ncbi:MAG: CBS domain-containing protein [Alphaproteobacteria bacterium]|nr:CBS domain-containing protein [Alphaproteobacteria bacterium]
MRAADIMTRNVVSVSPGTPASRVVRLCLTQGTTGVPVVDAQRRLVGMIGQGNLVRGAETGTKKRALWLQLLAAGMTEPEQLLTLGDVPGDQIMDPNVIVTSEDASIEELAKRLVEHDIELIPVVHAGILTGIIGRSDVLSAFSHPVERA